VRAAEGLCLTGIERRVNAAKDDDRPARPRDGADFVATKRVARVYPDSDDIARLDAAGVERFQRLVGDARRSI
jgi:hypothetical protein